MEISVCAVVGLSEGRLDHALAAQERQPRDVIRHADPLGAGLRLGLETGADWIWLLDGSAAPRPDALLALLAALERAAELAEPLLLAGVVLTEDGRVDEARAAWYRRSPTQPAMAAAERRLLPVRAAAGPILVNRRVGQVARAPRRKLPPPGALLEWTARALRSEVGYWVPQSEYAALSDARPPARDPRTAAALMLGGGFSGVEPLKLAFELALEGLPGIRPPAR